MKRHIRHILWIAGLIFVLRIPSLYQHIMDIDETAFSEFAKIILNGGVPYIDAVDNKPPFTYYFFYLVYSLSGISNLIIIHFVTLLWVIFTGFGVYLFASKFRGERAGFASAICFALMMHTYEPKYISSNGETLINLFLVLSAFIFIYVKVHGIKNLLLHVLSGIMLGLAVMTNYKAGILAVVFVIHSMIAEPLLSSDGLIRFRENFLKLLVTGLSSFIPVAAFALLFRLNGNFNEALFWGFLYNFGYIESGKGAFSSLKIIGRTGYFVLLTLPAWIAALKYAAEKTAEWRSEGESRADNAEFSHAAFIIIWLCFSVYAATVGGRGYGHYFIQIVPPLALAAGAGFKFIERYTKTFWIWLAIPALIFTAARIDMLKTYELVNYPNYRAEISFRKTGEYVKSASESGDRIYVWGWGTPVYYFADRRCASRFLISDFVSGRVFGTANMSGSVRNEMTGKYLPILVDDLKKSRPLFFIDTSPSGYFGYNRFPLSSYPELEIFIKGNYVKDSEIDGIVIYRIKAR